MFWSAAFERTSMHPAQRRVLFAVLPASLRRCIPRLYPPERSLTTSELRSTAPTSDLHRGIVCSSEPQLEYYDSAAESNGYARRPATAGDDQASSSSGSGRSDTSVTEMENSGAVMKYEVDSGLKWNRIVPAFNLLRNAGYEAQQPRSDSHLVRSLYINGLLYLLEALPVDLSHEEATSIRDRLPEEIKSTFPALPATAHNLGPGSRYARCTTEPSFLHRVLAYTIIQLFLMIQLLSPYAKIFLQHVYQYERTHRITERVVTATFGAADRMGKGGVSLGSAVLSFREGKVGTAVSDLTTWWIEGVTGGIYEGIGEGLVILGAARPNTGLGKESI